MRKTAGPWSCKITIRRVTTQAEEYTNQPSSVDFGPGITRKEDVDIWLRRAQAAVLSPHRSPEYFHNLSADQLKEPDPVRMAFTRNTVVVNLEDSDLTNMSFVDLPGASSGARARWLGLTSPAYRLDLKRRAALHRPGERPCQEPYQRREHDCTGDGLNDRFG